MSRCISVLSREDPNKPAKQIQAICYSQLEKNKSNPIISRFMDLKNALIRVFGDHGKDMFSHTMARLGVTRTNGKYDIDSLKSSDIPLPIAITKSDGSIEFDHMPLFENQFFKVAEDYLVVAAFANTPVADCDSDLIFPDAYKNTAEEFMREDGNIYFYHHPLKAGKILPSYTDKTGHIWKSQVNSLGWFVVSQPDPPFRQLIIDGKIKGYSIGGSFMMRPKTVGGVRVWERDSVRIRELSYVPSPCNKLCFLSIMKSQSQKVNESIETVVQSKGSKLQKNMKKGKINMTKDEFKIDNSEEEEDKPKEEDEEEEEKNLSLKEKMIRAKNSNEAHEIWEETIREEERQKQKQAWIDKAVKREKEQDRMERDMVPTKIRKIEEALGVITDTLQNFIAKSDAKFEEIESAPIFKTPIKDAGETEDILAKFGDNLNQTGDVTIALHEIDREFNPMLDNRGK